LVQTTSIPLKNLELVVSPPWTSQSSHHLEIRMGDFYLQSILLWAGPLQIH
jgi:hypothetical protein